MLPFCCIFFFVGVRGYRSHSLGGILSVYEALQRLYSLENVTRAPVDIVMSSKKWVKFKFCVNYPFKIRVQ